MINVNLNDENINDIAIKLIMLAIMLTAIIKDNNLIGTGLSMCISSTGCIKNCRGMCIPMMLIDTFMLFRVLLFSF